VVPAGQPSPSTGLTYVIDDVALAETEVNYFILVMNIEFSNVEMQV
jgi:hypothetical protein